jgi:hypothetical protein
MPGVNPFAKKKTEEPAPRMIGGRSGFVSLPSARPAAAPAAAPTPTSSGGGFRGLKAAIKRAVAAGVTQPGASLAPAAATPPPPPAAPVKAVAAPGAIDVGQFKRVSLDTSGIEKEAEVARSRASGREQAAVQAQRDAIARRAAMGGGGISGALQKQESLAMDASAGRLGEANEGIDAAKSGELRRIREAETQMNFAGEQAHNQLQAAAKEAAASREFASGEGAAQREFSAWAADLDRGMREKAMVIQQSQFAQQMDQSLKAFDWEKHIDEENLKIAARIQKLNEQEDPGLLGMGGLLGTGIGGQKGLLGTGIISKGSLIDTSHW